MSHSHSKIILHATYRTKNRHTRIPDALHEELWAYTHGILTHVDCPALQIGGVDDHLHLCLRLGRTISTGDLICKVKANTSRWLKAKGLRGFGWSTGYGIFSISQSHVERVVQYIRRQREHHRTMTFKEEYLELLRQNELAFDAFTLRELDL
ncbi:MAG: transposase [Ignavibacteriae bacterium]|nr:transposase [Ignavibacteriota bacterium]